MTDRAHLAFIDDRYSCMDSLGSGGMAQVLLAHDTVLGRDVAIKLLHTQYAEDPQFVERFRHEAQSAAALSHPNIVSVYDFGQSDDGAYYIAMEHVPGGTLKERLDREGQFSEAETASLGAQISDALGAAYLYGVIHRDIKPQNVLLTQSGDARVADFGIARAISPMSDSRTSLVLGTASYMSPEQATSEPLGPQSDLYSLGVVLYEMLTGRLPFEAESPVAMAFKQVYEAPIPPSEIEPSVSEGMDAIVMRLLAKRPADRYQSASELSDDLRRIQEGEAPAAAAAASPDETAALPTSGGVPRRRQRFPLAVLGVVAAIGLMAWAMAALLPEPQTGSGTLETPDLVGMQLPEARGALEEAGLEVGEIDERAASIAPDGEVVSQSPGAGSTVEPGSGVDLTVSSGDLGSGNPGSENLGSGNPGSGNPGSDGSGGGFFGVEPPGIGPSGNAGDQYSGSEN